MNEARENTMQAIAEYLEMLYFDECPEEWADRPSMHETENQIAEAIDLLQENKPEPIKPTFLTAIKSAFTAIFRRKATI